MSKKNLCLLMSLLWLSVFLNVARAKVDPPNYNFSLDQFTMFLPNAPLGPIQEKYGAGDLVSRKGNTNIFRFEIKQLRYKFPILVQVFNNKVLDFHATLPSYFLHDIYHQSIINRYGKQNKYLNQDEHSVYVWNQRDDFNITYEAACTITCFPISYSVAIKTLPEKVAGYKTISEQSSQRKKELQ